MTKNMSKVENLIAKLCPNGVEFKEIKTLLKDQIVTTVAPPRKLTKKHYKNTGVFPIVDQEQNFIVS
jgi:hypothetical protein